MALVRNTEAINLQHKKNHSHAKDSSLLDRDVFEENDNSNDFMAESIAEAEKEVKDGREPDLSE